MRNHGNVKLIDYLCFRPVQQKFNCFQISRLSSQTMVLYLYAYVCCVCTVFSCILTKCSCWRFILFARIIPSAQCPVLHCGQTGKLNSSELNLSELSWFNSILICIYWISTMLLAPGCMLYRKKMCLKSMYVTISNRNLETPMGIWKYWYKAMKQQISITIKG